MHLQTTAIKQMAKTGMSISPPCHTKTGTVSLLANGRHKAMSFSA